MLKDNADDKRKLTRQYYKACRTNKIMYTLKTPSESFDSFEP